MLESKCKLLELSDEVLMIILESLSTADLIFTSRTCSRLNRLCLDRRLMTKVVNPPDDYESMSLVFNSCINPRTTVLSLSSPTYPNRGSRASFSASSLLTITPCYAYLHPERTPRALTHLHLVRQSLDGRLFKMITMFPETLKVLELTGTLLTHITEGDQWFKGMSDHFKELEDLILKYCSWVTNHALLAISKCRKLTSLDFEGCRNIGDSIAYSSLAAMHGFNKLKILNLNNTDVRESDFQSFCKISTLEEFYVGKYGVRPYRGIPDSIIAYTVAVDCPNLRVIDISGCIIRRPISPQDLFAGLGLALLRKDSKLEKIYAHMMPRFPPNFIRTLQAIHPSLEIYQTPFV